MKTNLKKVISVIALVAILTLSISVTASAKTNDEIECVFENTTQTMLGLQIPTVSSTGGEWMVIGLARANKISDEFADGYYQNLCNILAENNSAKLHNSKSTENSKVVIALTSIKKDVTNVNGYNLLEPLADFDYLKKQGINGPVWALIAFDTLDYDIPQNFDLNSQTTREKLVDYILQLQLSNGGWALFGNDADVDITSMAIQSLAPYYNSNNDVKTAIDSALELLSSMQTESGTFTSWGAENCESSAQVITALTSININPDTDVRFIKNGNSALDGIMTFSVENGFSHTVNSSYNQMTTEQAYYSLASYFRLVNGKTSLYDMSDLKKQPQDVNGDGLVNIADCTCIQKYLAGLTTLDTQQLSHADFDQNGRVTISDATLMQKYFAGIY